MMIEIELTLMPGITKEVGMKALISNKTEIIKLAIVVIKNFLLTLLSKNNFLRGN